MIEIAVVSREFLFALTIENASSCLCTFHFCLRLQTIDENWKVYSALFNFANGEDALWEYVCFMSPGVEVDSHCRKRAKSHVYKRIRRDWCSLRRKTSWLRSLNSKARGTISQSFRVASCKCFVVERSLHAYQRLTARLQCCRESSRYGICNWTIH